MTRLPPGRVELAAFAPAAGDLERALLLLTNPPPVASHPLPAHLPERGIGPAAAIEQLATPVLAEARDLGAPGFFAHMDPPTPWISWVMQLFTASRNQNLLHPDTAPAARELEARVIAWLAPVFAMSGGHLTPGSTLANLTAIWAAREAGATTVVASRAAHLSVAKAAHLLGMTYRQIESWQEPLGSLDRAVAVITAGTTATGEIESLDAAGDAAWRHVDAAWAGPLRLSDRHRSLLDGIERADSVAVSAHKWLFQPKESALVLFSDVEAAHRSVSFGADYLAVPNVGLLGSHGATAMPLLATLLAYGRTGLASWIDRTMELVDELADVVAADARLEARSSPHAGVFNWRHHRLDAFEVQRRLPPEVFVSATTIDGAPWLRSVAANPMADPTLVAVTVAAL